MTCSVPLFHREVVAQSVREEKTNDLRMFDGVHAVGMEDTTERREPRVAQRLGGAPSVQQSNWRQLNATEPDVLHGCCEEGWINAGASKTQEQRQLRSAGWCDAGHSRTRGCKLPCRRDLEPEEDMSADGGNNTEGAVAHDEPLVLRLYQLYKSAGAPHRGDAESRPRNFRANVETVSNLVDKSLCCSSGSNQCCCTST